MEVTRLHIEGPRCRFEFGLMDAALKGLRSEVEVTIPCGRLLLGRLAAKVGAQSVLVLADDARYEDLRVRQRDVCERLTCLGQKMRLLDLEGFQVHHRQHAIHRRARPVSWCHIVIMLDDISAVTDTHELGIMRPFHLRRGDSDKTLHHHIARQRRFPTSRQDTGRVRSGLGLLCQGIRLTELKACADDAVLLRSGGILDVGGGDDGTVVKEFKIGVAAVRVAGAGRIAGGSVGVMQQLDPILALASVLNVLQGANPRHIVTVGVAGLGPIAKGHDQAAIGSSLDDVSVAGQGGWQFLRFAPIARVVRAQ